MNYTLRKPCGNCPFRRKGGIRLLTGRVLEIASIFTNGASGDFVCHKTAVAGDDDGDDDGGRAATEDSQHCAGALLFAEKHGTPTQMMRIVERLGLYDASKLVGHDEVFDDVDEWLETALDRQRRRRGRR